MASVNSVSSSSSLYGSRNVLSGLASGMDTESMIENIISGTKSKITALQKKSTKITWQQESMRNIIDLMVNFSNKYASYTSSTNLLSSSFFNNAVKTTTGGANADMISATGKSSSSIEILGVKALATAGTYGISAGALNGAADGSDPTIAAAETIDLTAKQELSNVAGSLTIKYGSRDITMEFGDLETYKTSEDFLKGIQEKLDGITLSNSKGEMVKASTMVKAELKNGNIVFTDKQGAGNKISIASAAGKIKDTLGIDPSEESDTLKVKNADLVDEDGTKGDYLSGKEISVTLDGVTKKITLPKYDANSTEADVAKNAADFVSQFNDALDKAFGDGKIRVTNTDTSGDAGKMNLSFTTDRGSTMSISSGKGNIGKALGLASDNETSYLNTGKTLGELNIDWSLLASTGEKVKGTGTITATKDANGKIIEHRDANNKLVDKDGYRIETDADGKALKNEDGSYVYMETYKMEINGVEIGKFNKDTALESVLVAINNNTEAGVNVTYSKTTNNFKFTAQETGAANGVEIKSDQTGGKESNLAAALFGTADEHGTDAVLSMKVNGDKFENITRSSNTFNVDGLSVTLKGEFGYKDKMGTDGVTPEKDTNGNVVKELDNTADAVTFTSTSDTEKIVEVVKGMVKDYNEMMEAIKTAYAQTPAVKANKTRYEPLSDEDMEGMSETAIKNYEEKAKQGILFADGDLSSLYEKMRFAFSPSGTDGSFLRSIGLTTNYSSATGNFTVELNENDLRTALENNPDAVRDAFTKTKENGSATNGIMQTLKTQLDNYAKVTGDKGILVKRAGSIRAPSSINSNALQDQLNNIDKQIEKWQDKMSDQIDRYTSKFSRLEVLIQQMNAQSSQLAGLMGTG